MFGAFLNRRRPPADAAAAGPSPLTDPQLMLHKQRQARGFNPSILSIALAVALVAEVGLPQEQKPSKMAGNAAANFNGEIMSEDLRRTLDAEETVPMARARGHMETQVAQMRGICAATVYLDPKLAVYCRAMGDAYFNEVLPRGRTYRENYQGGERK